jgi:ATP-binding protein involved in chromosome partitioning
MEVRTSVIDKRLEKIKRIIAISSGKGGVGKSLIASSLALNLVSKSYKVGLLDLDFYGPSSHIILGVKDFSFPEEKNGIIPIDVHGIKFISIVFFTDNKPSPFRGSDITNIIIEILAITQWGDLDFLIIDMPPGTGDETLDVISYIKKTEYLIITTPSKVAMGAVEKLLNILKEFELPVIGIIENMSFHKSSYIKQKIIKMDFNYINSISFDEKIENAIGLPKKLFESSFMNEFEKIIFKII